eukprot:636854-Amphidinium_carterae.1
MEGSRLKEAEVVKPSMEFIYRENVTAKTIVDVPERIIFSRWLDTWKPVDEGETAQPEDHKAVALNQALSGLRAEAL